MIPRKTLPKRAPQVAFRREDKAERATVKALAVQGIGVHQGLTTRSSFFAELAIMADGAMVRILAGPNADQGTSALRGLEK